MNNMTKGLIIITAFIIVLVICGCLYKSFWTNYHEGFQPNYDGIYDGALTVQTMSNTTKDEVDKILGQILNQLNEQTGKRYFLRKIDRLNITPLKKGDIGCENSFKQTGEFVLGARYTVDFFAHELRNQETRRFITIFAVDLAYNVTVEHLSYSNAFLDENAVNPSGQAYKPMSGPGSLIISDESLLVPGKYHIQGLKDATGLDSSSFKAEGDIPAGHAGAWETGQVFLPISFNISADKYHPDQLWPNRRQSKWWDSNGVFLAESTDDQAKRVGLEHGTTYGINGAMLNPSFAGTSQLRPPGVYDNPTVNRLESNSYDTASHDIFDLARGNMALGHSF